MSSETDDEWFKVAFEMILAINFIDLLQSYQEFVQEFSHQSLSFCNNSSIMCEANLTPFVRLFLLL